MISNPELQSQSTPQPVVEAPHKQQSSDPKTLACSVGIMAYNEEANIASAIDAIVKQRTSSSHITELIVVASGCTDRTAEIVASVGRDDPRVRLITEERRQGKASAINLFVATAQSPVLLMVSADVLVKDGTLDALLRHFHDPGVGMVGGHPIPVNDETTFLGYAVHLLWRLHDRLAREAPKLGEIVAFRNVVPRIPPDTAVDEISIQALITQLGYRLVYEPEGVVYNHGPSTVGGSREPCKAQDRLPRPARRGGPPARSDSRRRHGRLAATTPFASGSTPCGRRSPARRRTSPARATHTVTRACSYSASSTFAGSSWSSACTQATS